jgi:hypothetical protein
MVDILSSEIRWAGLKNHVTKNPIRRKSPSDTVN